MSFSFYSDYEQSGSTSPESVCILWKSVNKMMHHFLRLGRWTGYCCDIASGLNLWSTDKHDIYKYSNIGFIKPFLELWRRACICWCPSYGYRLMLLHKGNIIQHEFLYSSFKINVCFSALLGSIESTPLTSVNEIHKNKKVWFWLIF